MAANIGSVATITGNPQNMMIGNFSGISYRAFAAALAPLAAAGLLVVIGVIALIYRREFQEEPALVVERKRVTIRRALLWKSVIASICMIVLFFSGWPVPKVAMASGALLLITRRIKPEKIYREIDWPLLVMFVGLFIVVAGLERTALASDLLALSRRLHLERAAVLSVCAALLSNTVSNVPAVLVFKPLVAHLPDPRHAWLVLAMSSTLSGNLTLLGSMANLIVVQRARQHAPISFWEYSRTGVPVTILTLAIGIVLLR